MNTSVICTLNGLELKVTNNAVFINDGMIKNELIKRLIDCKAFTPIGESALPLFFNKYLRNYNIENVRFIEESAPFNNYSEAEDMADSFISIAA